MGVIMKKIEKILLAILILWQPFLDMLRNTELINIEILGLSLLELTNIFLVIGIMIIVILKKEKRGLLKYLGFFVLIFIYLILHYYNTTLFNLDVYNKQVPNFLVESYHIFITFLLPLILLFSLIESKIKKEDVITLLKYLSLIISTFIVVLNILKLSYQAYEDLQIIKYNLWDWFTYHGSNYHELTSRGLFYSTNQISAILLMILPIVILCCYKERKAKNYFILGMQILAMFMLGTKVGTIGVYLSLLAFFGIYYFNGIVKEKWKKKDIRPLIAMFIISFIFFFFTPLGISFRLGEEITTPDRSEKDDFQKMYQMNCKDEKTLLEERDFIINFIEEHQEELNIHEYILSSYLPDIDLTYWCTFLQNKNLPINDYRQMKTNILDRIYIRNNNSNDKWLGMGYSLNYIYTEKDYSFQFYLYGIFGLILFIVPYFLIVFKSIFKLLIKFKENCTVTNLMLFLPPIIGLGVAYFSGHVFERTFPMLILAVVTSILYKSEKSN